MSDPNSSEPRGDDLTADKAYVFEHFSRLYKLAVENPALALPKIKESEQMLRESGAQDSEVLHLLYFLAYSGLAYEKHDDEAETVNEEVPLFCEKAVEEYRLAIKLAQYEEVEHYSEEVVTRPAGLFRKAQTETVGRTRTVTKNRLEAGNWGERFEYVLEVLEKHSPGRVHEILGEVKLKYLVSAKRVLWPPILRQALENGNITRDEFRSIGELALKAPSPIRSVVVSWANGGDEPELLLLFFDRADFDSGGQRQFTGSCKIQKKRGVWSVHPGPS